MERPHTAVSHCVRTRRNPRRKGEGDGGGGGGGRRWSGKDAVKASNQSRDTLSLLLQELRSCFTTKGVHQPACLWWLLLDAAAR